MKVTIERRAGKTKTGLFFGTVHAFMIDIQVTFTETELAAIKKANLTDYVLIDRPFHPGYQIKDEQEFIYRSAQLLRVVRLIATHEQQKAHTVFYAPSLPEADMAEHKLREALQGLKNAIENATASRPTKDSFEL